MSVNNPNFPKKPQSIDIPVDNQDIKTNVDDVFIGLKAPDNAQVEAKLRSDAEVTGQLNLPDMPTKPIIPEFPKTEQDMLMARIRAMEAELFMLKNGRNGVKVTEKPAKQIVLDFTKLSEKDVFNMDIPFEIVEHDLPDYIMVQLKDSNYVPRWVNKNPRRIGPMKSQGWTFVTKDDLAVKLKIDLDIDENGMFRFDDVVLMKCEKAKYYGMLRRNHERALAQVNPKQAHATAKAQVQKDLASSSDGAGEYQKYTSLGKLEVYVPGQDGI